MAVHIMTSGYVPDLTSCDKEPIRTPGTIQPFGMLLAGPHDLARVEYCSGNSQELIGKTPSEILGVSFTELLGNSLVHDARNILSLSTARTQRERLGTFDIGGRDLDAYVHLNPDGKSVVELEPLHEPPSNRATSPIDQMRKLLTNAAARADIKTLLDVCTAGLLGITGYDRVMAYRYAPNGDGEVVSEARVGNAASMLGLRYPAWDIPQQARQLQVANPLRLLTGIDDEAVPLMAYGETAPPLDLGLAHLRGVSAIHVEYLRNMGVSATLTVALVIDGQVWGMFAFHHLSHKILPAETRVAVELFGQMISLVIKQKLDLELTNQRHRAAEARERVMVETDAKTDLLKSFPKLAPILADVVPSDGLAITYEGKILTYKSTPAPEFVRQLEAIEPGKEDLIYPIENLSALNLAPEEQLAASGAAMIIRATAAFPMQLIYFRDEETQRVKWAGKPDKQMDHGPLGPRITPRGSFDAYMEERRGYGPPWNSLDLTAATELQVMMTQITAKGERLQLLRHQDLVTHQRQQDLMIAELNHRVKNILALIRSLSRQAKASAASLESYARALEQRISALAVAHDLAVSNTMNGVSLRSVLSTELAPYLSDDVAQVLMTGPVIGLRPDVAPMIALVLHEVVSNAAKYGALSSPDGVVRARWSQNDRGLKFSWREIGGPEVSEPKRHGFGRSLIERAIPYELDGNAELVFDRNGVRFDFELPVDALVDLDQEDSPALVGQVATVQKPATGKRALLVEDNLLLSMDMVENLSRLGTEGVVTAASVEEATALAKSAEFDFAVLDMNLRGTVSFDVADALLERGKPFLFVTGYGSRIDVPQRLSDIQILTKPIELSSLAQSVEEIFGKRSGGAGEDKS